MDLRTRVPRRGEGVADAVDRCHRVHRHDIRAAAAAAEGLAHPGASSDGLLGVDLRGFTDDQDVADVARQRKRTVVLQQDGALTADLAGGLATGVVVDRGLNERPVEDAVLEHLHVPSLQRPVDVRHLDLPSVQRGLQQAWGPLQRDRHQVVQAVAQGVDGALGGEEVRLDVTLEAPLLTQHVSQLVLVLARRDTVDVVVGAHDRGHVAVLDRHLEGDHVGLVQGALVHGGLQRHPVGLLFVGDVVLGHRDHALVLHRLDLRHGHLTGQVRVLTEVLEVAPQDRQASQVHTRRLEDVQCQVVHLRADDTSELSRDLLIERRGQGRGRRQRGRLGRRGVRVGHSERHVRVVEGRVDAVVLADTHGPVGDAQRGDGQRWDSGHMASAVALRQFRHDLGKGAGQLLHLLRKRETLNQKRRPLLRRQRRIHPRQGGRHRVRGRRASGVGNCDASGSERHQRSSRNR